MYDLLYSFSEQNQQHKIFTTPHCPIYLQSTTSFGLLSIWSSSLYHLYCQLVTIMNNTK
jgi:hypothetical protein